MFLGINEAIDIEAISCLVVLQFLHGLCVVQYSLCGAKERRGGLHVAICVRHFERWEKMEKESKGKQDGDRRRVYHLYEHVESTG